MNGVKEGSYNLFVLTGMQKQMVLQISMLRESSRADVTFVRPGPTMDIHMALQVARSRE